MNDTYTPEELDEELDPEVDYQDYLDSLSDVEGDDLRREIRTDYGEY